MAPSDGFEVSRIQSQRVTTHLMVDPITWIVAGNPKAQASANPIRRIRAIIFVTCR